MHFLCKTLFFNRGGRSRVEGITTVFEILFKHKSSSSVKVNVSLLLTSQFSGGATADAVIAT